MTYLKPLPLNSKAACLALLAISVSLTACQSETESTEVGKSTGESTVAVLTTQPQPATLELPAFAGQTRPHFEHQLAFQTSGRLSQRLVRAGDSVSKGQLLFELDNQDQLLRLEQANKTLIAAQQRFVTVQAQLKRTQHLRTSDLASAANVEDFQAALEEARARKASAQAEVELAQNHVNYTRINSPVDGFVVEIFAESEAIVSPGQAIATVGAKDTTDVVVDLPESWLPVPLSGHVQFSNGQRFPVSLYDNAMQANPTTRTWQARYLINGQPPKGFGRLVQVQLEKQNKSPGPLFSLPIAALDERGQGAQIWQVKSQRAIPLPIQVLQLLPDRFIFMAQNIDETQPVVAAGTHKLRTDLAVKPIKGL